MAQTPRFKLPLLSASQAQKHLTHNEALLLLDLLVGIIPVSSRALVAPGGAEPDGTVMILGGAGTGAWAGFGANDLALKLDGSWRRVLPTTAMIATIANEAGKLVYFNGAAWADATGLSSYQEGVWTPGISFGGLSVGVTYGANNGGRYTKIGRLVTATFWSHLSSKGTSTGAAALTGLPFAAGASPILGVLTAGWAAGVAGVSGTIQGTVPSSSQTVSFFSASGGASSTLTNSNFTASSQIMGMVTYEV